MKDGAYLLSHGGTVPGREPFVGPLFQRSRNFWRQQEAQGLVKAVGPFFLTPGGGARDDMAYFTLYQGKLTDLSRITTSEEYERIYAVAAQVTKNLKGRLFGGGTEEEVNRILTVSAAEWSASGLMKG
jgi:hypothetical protein